jgi:BirA family biotin operon repressor/biotin-[acetyl-CoA-carboxylase] ligase
MDRPETEQLAERLLELIRKRPEHRFSFVELAGLLKVESVAISGAVQVLADWDYVLRRRRDTVTFVAPADALTATELGYKLSTKVIGRTILAYGSVKSTNDIAAQMAVNGAEDGTVVTADEQVKGRGRLGRVWYSPPGTGAYISTVLRPDFPPEQAPATSIMTAVALADALSEFCGPDVKIKWPNDVLIGGRKIAGILTELSADRGKINHIIVGVGININQTARDFPEEIKPLATSVRRVLKRKVRRVEIVQSFLRHLDREYAAYQVDRLKKSHERIRKYSSLIGRIITIRVGRHDTTGLVTDIDVNGCLVMDVDGESRAVTAGEVTVVKR